MITRLIENKTQDAVTIRTNSGSELVLPPGQKLENLDVQNVDEVRQKGCRVVQPLND